MNLWKGGRFNSSNDLQRGRGAMQLEKLNSGTDTPGTRACTKTRQLTSKSTARQRGVGVTHRAEMFLRPPVVFCLQQATSSHGIIDLICVDAGHPRMLGRATHLDTIMTRHDVWPGAGLEFSKPQRLFCPDSICDPWSVGEGGGEAAGSRRH